METVVALPATETPSRELKEDAALAAVAVEALQPETAAPKAEEPKEEATVEAAAESAPAPAAVEDLKKSSPPKKR